MRKEKTDGVPINEFLAWACGFDIVMKDSNHTEKMEPDARERVCTDAHENCLLYKHV